MAKNAERSRKWFITWNNYDIEKFANGLAGATYYYCIHNETDNIHLHCVLEYDNAKAFSSIKSLFPQAHIEKVANIYYCVQYLTHKNDTTDKKKYLFEDIKTNNPTLLKTYYNSTEYCFIDNDIDLYNDIEAGFDIQQLLACRKYSYRFLNTRLSIVKEHITLKESTRRLIEYNDNVAKNNDLPF